MHDFLSRFSITQRLYAAFAFSLLVLLGISLVALQGLSRTEQRVSGVVERIQPGGGLPRWTWNNSSTVPLLRRACS